MKKLLLILSLVFSTIAYCQKKIFLPATGSLYIKQQVNKSKKISFPATGSLMFYTNKIYTK